MAESRSIELLTLITPLNLSRIFEEPTSVLSVISYRLTVVCADYFWHHPSQFMNCFLLKILTRITAHMTRTNSWASGSNAYGTWSQFTHIVIFKSSCSPLFFLFFLVSTKRSSSHLHSQKYGDLYGHRTRYLLRDRQAS